MRFNTKFDLEFSVKNRDAKKVEQLLFDNKIAMNTVKMVYNELTEFTCYDVTIRRCEAIRQLLFKESMTTY